MKAEIKWDEGKYGTLYIKGKRIGPLNQDARMDDLGGSYFTRIKYEEGDQELTIRWDTTEAWENGKGNPHDESEACDWDTFEVFDESNVNVQHCKMKLNERYERELTHWDKQLEVIDRAAMRAMGRKPTAEETAEVIAENMQKAGPTFVAWVATLARYKNEGVQIRVSKEVAHDLDHSDIPDPGFDQILMWPAKSMEIYTEDPKYPTILLEHFDPSTWIDDIRTLAPGKVWDRVECESNFDDTEMAVRISVVINTPEGLKSSCVTIPESMYTVALKDASCMGDAAADAENGKGIHIPLTGAEHEDMSEMLMYCHKVLLYAQTPYVEDVPTKTITRKMGGKPGHNGRPNKPIKRLIDLPVVHRRAHEAEARQAAEKRTKAYNGRRGHFKTLRHKRWKKKRGQTIYVPPSPGPDGTIPRTYRVRKVTASPM